jgi:glyoxylase-like metal-dependent hydrolase (beta-lactamase superfamily II)
VQERNERDAGQRLDSALRRGHDPPTIKQTSDDFRPVYRVRALKVGETEVNASECLFMQRVREWQRLVYVVLVLEGDGRTVVVNTGPPPDLAPLNEAWRTWGERLWGAAEGGRRMQMRVLDEERLPAVLERAGVDPDAVDDVILTPIASYATGNLRVFRNARYWFSRRGWVDLHAPEPDLPRAGERAGYLPDDVRVHLELAGAGQVRLLEDEHQVAPGISTFWVGGHHRSSIAVKVATRRGAVVHTDCCFLRRNVDEDVPIGAAQSQLECWRAYARIRREADVLVPGYDPEITRYEGGVVA